MTFDAGCCAATDLAGPGVRVWTRFEYHVQRVCGLVWLVVGFDTLVYLSYLSLFLTFPAGFCIIFIIICRELDFS